MQLNSEQQKFSQDRMALRGVSSIEELHPEDRLALANLATAKQQRRGLDTPVEPDYTFHKEAKVSDDESVNGWILDVEKLSKEHALRRLEIDELWRLYKASARENHLIEPSLRSFSSSDIRRFKERLEPFIKNVDQ